MPAPKWLTGGRRCPARTKSKRRHSRNDRSAGVLPALDYSLSLILLDDLGWPKMSVGRIAAEFFQSAPLAQQVPILVKLDLDLLQPLLIGIGRGTMLIEALLFRYQFPNVVEHRPVGRLYLPGGMFVGHLQFSKHMPVQMSADGHDHKMVISVIPQPPLPTLDRARGRVGRGHGG